MALVSPVRGNGRPYCGVGSRHHRRGEIRRLMDFATEALVKAGIRPSLEQMKVILAEAIRHAVQAEEPRCFTHLID